MSSLSLFSQGYKATQHPWDYVYLDHTSSYWLLEALSVIMTVSEPTSQAFCLPIILLLSSLTDVSRWRTPGVSCLSASQYRAPDTICPSAQGLFPRRIRIE